MKDSGVVDSLRPGMAMLRCSGCFNSLTMINYRADTKYRRIFKQVGFVITVGNNISALCIGGNDGGNDGFAQLIIYIIDDI